MAALVREPTEKDVEREAQRGETLAQRQPALTALDDFTQARDAYESTPPDQRHVPVLPITSPVPAVTPAIGGAPTVPFTSPGSLEETPDQQRAPAEPAALAPAEPAAASSPMAALADRLFGAQQQTLDRADVLRREKAEAMQPPLEAVEAAQQRFIEAMGQYQMRPRPATTPPPSRGLRDFLAPIDGEPPERSLGRLIQAIGLFAMGVGGLSRGYATAGLSALVGAMQGWQEGDTIRADRAFSDWKEKTEHAVKEWEREQTSIKDAMTNANMELQQRFKLVEITSLMHDNKIAAEIARAKDLEGMAKYITERAEKADTLSVEMQKVVQAAADRLLAREQAEAIARERLEFQREQAEANNQYKAAMLKLQQDQLEDRKAGRADAAIARRATLEDKLRADFMAASKNAIAVRDAYERVKVSARPSPTGERAAGDMSMVYAFMKMLDPESVVREAEQRMAMETGSFAEKAKAWMAHLQTGAVFTDKMRADFLTRSEMLYNVARDQQRRVTDQFRAIAQGQDLNVQSAVPDLFGVGGGTGTSSTPDFSSWPVREKK